MADGKEKLANQFDDETDPWLTLSEIAERLRLNPSTVRAWVSKGQLPATRVGMRKWMVRRSDLQSMLAEANETPDEILDRLGRGGPARLTWTEREDPHAGGGESLDEEAADDPLPGGPALPAEPTPDQAEVVKAVEQSMAGFTDAMSASALAPPSAGYLDRLEAIANACVQLSTALLGAARDAGATWRPQPDGDASLAYELRAGGNRMGGPEMWEQFDRSYQSLASYLASTDIHGVAVGYLEVGAQLFTVISRLKREAQDGDPEPATEL